MVNVGFSTKAKLDQGSSKEWSRIVVETEEQIFTISYLNLIIALEVFRVFSPLVHTAYQKNNGDGMLRI